MIQTPPAAIATLETPSSRRPGSLGDPEERRALVAAWRFSLLVTTVVGFGAILAFLLYFSPASQLARTRQSLVELRVFLAEARAVRHQTLLAITGNACTECPCKQRGSLTALPDADTCRANWRAALTKAYATRHGREPLGPAGEDLLPSSWKRDAWGSPFLLNENEGEGGAGDCTRDIVRSAGPDGLIDTADDLFIDLPPEACQEKAP